MRKQEIFCFPLISIFLQIFFIIKNTETSSKIIYIFPNTTLGLEIWKLGGASFVEPGTIFQYAPGIYNKNQSASKLYGTSNKPIKILGGPEVILEYSFYFEQLHYVDLIGPFELRNIPSDAAGGGNALTIYNSSHILVTRFFIHHTYKNGMYIGGSNNIIRENIIFDCVLMNYKNNNTSNGQGLAVGNRSNLDEYLGRNNLIENNLLMEIWGEGIDLLYCNGCWARNNTVRNAFSVLLYTDNSKNLLIENNFLYITTDEFNRDKKKNRASGIGIGRESHGLINTTNITIRNNLIVGSIHGVSHIGSKGYYSEIRIVHNTFYNVTYLAMQFPGAEFPELVKNNEVSNNLFSGGFNYNRNRPEEKKTWKAFANGWISENKVNEILLETEGTNTTFRIKKNMSESIFPWLKNSECYDIKCYLPRCLDDIPKNDPYGNVVIGKGIKSAFSNGLDFFGRKRDKDRPSIGFSEFCYLPDNWVEKNEGISSGTIVVIVIIIIGIVGGLGYFLYRRYFKRGIMSKINLNYIHF